MKIYELLENKQNIIGSLVETIQRDCKPFLEHINYQVDHNVMYRGVGGRKSPPPSLLNPDAQLPLYPGHNPNRKSVDTPTYIHDGINDIFEKQFHCRFRNGVFATGSSLDASSYGTPCIMLPVGDFRFLWSPKVVDLFNEWEAFAREYTKTYGKGRDWQEVQNEFLRDVAAGVYDYTDTNLEAAIQSKHEIMLYSDHYYLLPTKNTAVVAALKQIQKQGTTS